MRWARAAAELVLRHPAVILTATLPLVLLELGVISLSGGELSLPLPTLRVATRSSSPLGLALAAALALGVAPFFLVGMELVAYGLLRGLPVSPASVLVPLLRRPVRVLGTFWVMGLGISLASLLLLIPGVVLALSWAFALLLALAFPRGSVRPWRVSAELARGRRIRLFFLLLGIILFMGAGEALAFVVGGRLLPLGFALWL
ncbi:MAG: hypothetical protein ABDI20_04950, partial [Candidatus Bipolaricaulaceae bacterium]